MRRRTLDFTWTRPAVVGLLLGLALLLAIVVFMPVQAQSGCVEWDDHGNCVAWEDVGIDTSQAVAPAPTPTVAA